MDNSPNGSSKSIHLGNDLRQEGHISFRESYINILADDCVERTDDITLLTGGERRYGTFEYDFNRTLN